jgi:3-oxoacyl-(acyl-carrier-protein) synthase
MRALSASGVSRPFDVERDGFCVGEGAAVLVLEEAGHAAARGAHAYVELAGAGSTADAYHLTAPEPSARGALACMRAALHDARVSAADVTHINAHGTSTPLNDAAETRALRTVFGAHANRLRVSSSKSMIGHLLGGSGGVECVLSALMIHEGVVNPTINYETPDPECDLDYVPNTSREMRHDHVVSNSLGFGGHNVSLLLSRFEG